MSYQEENKYLLENAKVGDRVLIRQTYTYGWNFRIYYYQVGTINSITPKRKKFIIDNKELSGDSLFSLFPVSSYYIELDRKARAQIKALKAICELKNVDIKYSSLSVEQAESIAEASQTILAIVMEVNNAS